MLLNHSLSDDEVIRLVYSSNPSQTEMLLLTRLERALAKQDEIVKALRDSESELSNLRDENATLESHLANRPELIWAEGN